MLDGGVLPLKVGEQHQDSGHATRIRILGNVRDPGIPSPRGFLLIGRVRGCCSRRIASRRFLQHRLQFHSGRIRIPARTVVVYPRSHVFLINHIVYCASQLFHRSGWFEFNGLTCAYINYTLVQLQKSLGWIHRSILEFFGNLTKLFALDWYEEEIRENKSSIRRR